jgi:hypothetical protein
MTESIALRFDARAALESLSLGQPPSPELTDFISVGMEHDLDTFASEYFSKSIGLLPNTTQGAFKIVEAYYGGGKTHYLRSVERLGHRHGLASAFVELHKDSCPLTRFDSIYAKVVETLTLPMEGQSPAHGLGAVLRAWVTASAGSEVSAIEYAEEQLAAVGDLPLPSMRIAIRDAAHSIASGDRATLDEVLVYLHAGKVSPTLRKRGILEAIDARTGALALRSLAVWLRQIGVPGLVLVMDEGDRSLSIASTKDRTAASNNLVQLINETVRGADWPGVLFLYSIPTWQDFQHAFSDNMALIQRVRNTGFPNLPPAPRIVLDDRFPTDDARQEFCLAVGVKLFEVFSTAYPGALTENAASALANTVARVVVGQTVEVSFRRLFVQSYIAAMYMGRGGRVLTKQEVEQIVNGELSKLVDS